MRTYNDTPDTSTGRPMGNENFSLSVCLWARVGKEEFLGATVLCRKEITALEEALRRLLGCRVAIDPSATLARKRLQPKEQDGNRKGTR